MAPYGLGQGVKTFRIILILFGLAVLLFAPMLLVDSYKARRAREEHTRMEALRLLVIEKLESYEKANGHYPDSLAVLSFTNSQREIEMSSELNKIRYRLTHPASASDGMASTAMRASVSTGSSLTP